MLIGYPSPLLKPGAGVTWSGIQVTSLAGAVDGRSGTLTKLAWGGAEGAPSASETIRASFPDGDSVKPRQAALINLEGLPAGIAVTVSLKAVGGDYDVSPQELETFKTPSGDIAVVAVWPAGIENCDGVEFEIFNTDDSIDYDQEFSLGEIVLSEAADLELDPSWSSGVTDSAGQNISKNGQLYKQPVPAGRWMGLNVTPAMVERALIDPDSLSTLQMALANDPRCLVIADTSSQARINRTSVYGYAERIEEIRFDRHEQGGARFRFVEMVGRAV